MRCFSTFGFLICTIAHHLSTLKQNKDEILYSRDVLHPGLFVFRAVLFALEDSDSPRKRVVKK